MPAPELPRQLSVPLTRARVPHAVLPPRVVPGGQRERGGTDYVVPMDLSLGICPLIRASLRSATRQLAMPGRPAPQLRARRGTPVLHQHHHQSRRHCRHHHLAYHRHRSSSVNNNSKGSGRPASKVIGRSRALSKCPPSPFPYWFSFHVVGYQPIPYLSGSLLPPPPKSLPLASPAPSSKYLLALMPATFLRLPLLRWRHRAPRLQLLSWQRRRIPRFRLALPRQCRRAPRFRPALPRQCRQAPRLPLGVQ
jgi:hypothetical protein